MQTYETTQPWVVYTYTSPDPQHDGAFTAAIRMECCVCGGSAVCTLDVPAKGKEPQQPADYRHPDRVAFLAVHRHQPLPHALTWVKPLLNPAAHNETLDVLEVVARTVTNTEPAP